MLPDAVKKSLKIPKG